MPTATRAARPAPISAEALRRRLTDLAMNLHWSWEPGAHSLFESLDPALFAATRQNPLRTLALLPSERREQLAADAGFLARLGNAEATRRAYLAAKPWFARGRARDQGMLVAYFCSEYAVHESMQQYSGGLGVLAGDHLKSASDLGIPLVAVGLLYRRGYYTQQFAPDGSTRVLYPVLDFADLPVRDTSVIVDVPMGRRSVRARVWRQDVGRVALYLLDTDVADNAPGDRALTAHLYGGDRDYRIRQEILLGIGGLLALDALRIQPTVFHLNEGHAAFNCLERLRRRLEQGDDYDRAVDAVRRCTVFTTHTPVPAGNDRFVQPLVMKYFAGLARAMGLSKQQFMALGREAPANREEEFCMTVLALRLSKRCNGVAELHGETSRRMWTRVYGVADPAAAPIGAVTNGIHIETWLAPEARPFYQRHLRPRWNGTQSDVGARADRIPAAEFWALRCTLRQRLAQFLRERLAQQAIRRGDSPEQVALARAMFDPSALTIGFARRFATYKRAPLVFSDPARLARLLNDPRRPVQIVFAGKAHPADLGGQAFAAQIFRFTQDPRFRGRVALLEDYDMMIGRMLTSGCDVWLNNPLRPQEASGTSGMKPPLHGGVNCSILDGWWPEAFDGTNGFAIGDGRSLPTQKAQDRYDVGCLYDLLEQKIVPEFYRRDRAGIPAAWVKRMARSMQTVCPKFNTHRMLRDYLEGYYAPAHHDRA